MGSNQGQDNDPYFDAKRYTRPGIRLEEIKCIRQNFLSFNPTNEGFINTQVVLNKYKDAYQMSNLKRDFGTQKYINFDTFYHSMSNILISRKQNMAGVQFDSGTEQAQCICYPSV